MNDLEVIRQIEELVSKTAGEKIELMEVERNKIKGRGFSFDEFGKVIDINLSNCKIIDLSEIVEYLIQFKNLKTLELNDNKIINIEPLKNLSQIIAINLDNNKIIDISPLKELKNIECIFCQHNRITNLSPLFELYKNPIFNALIDKNPIKDVPLIILQDGDGAIKDWCANDGFKAYLDTISIENYFCIENIELNNLADKKEIYFLGENGTGKTLLSQALVIALRASFDNKTVNGWLLDNQKFNKENLQLSATDKDNLNFGFSFPNPQVNYAKTNVFAYGVNRNRTADEASDNEGFLTLFGEFVLLKPDTILKEIERLELKKIGKLRLSQVIKILTQIINIEEKKQVISIEQNPNTGAFYYIEQGTELKFEQLSDGYKSALIWMSDLISRLATNQPDVTEIEDFKAIVLVDEVDLFLHPRWAYKLVGRLRTLFSNIQWFFTTHSPIITLGASKDAVFYKLYKDEKGKTQVSEPFAKPLNMTANSMITSMLWQMDTFTTKDISSSAVSSDDYVFQKIHDVIAKKVVNMPELQESDVLKMIEEELKKLEKGNAV